MRTGLFSRRAAARPSASEEYQPSLSCSCTLEATAAGRVWIAEKRDALLAAQDELLSVLGAEERSNLISSLQRLLMSQPAELVANPPVEVRAR